MSDKTPCDTSVGVCLYECIVDGVDGDVVFCTAHFLPNHDSPQEFWEIVVPGHKWTEGDAFYMVLPNWNVCRPGGEE